jgi:predicted RNase H-like nuclease
MKYEITTKQDKKYTVSDENAWLWVEIERELGYTVSQAAEKMSQGSLDVITCMLFKAAKAQNLTQMPNQQAWVINEFETFEVVEDDPKDN